MMVKREHKELEYKKNDARAAAAAFTETFCNA